MPKNGGEVYLNLVLKLTEPVKNLIKHLRWT